MKSKDSVIQKRSNKEKVKNAITIWEAIKKGGQSNSAPILFMPIVLSLLDGYNKFD